MGDLANADACVGSQELGVKPDKMLKAPRFLEDILNALTHDGFIKFLDAFIARECHKFLRGGAGEHTLEQTEAHAGYVRLYGAHQ